MTDLSIGQRVTRREDRSPAGGVVVAADASVDGMIYFIAYDEGGEGWWPREGLEPEEST